MRILAIDPGTEKSAWVVWDSKNGTILWAEKESNEILLTRLRSHGFFERAVIEGISSFGMPVGREVFETCYFIGRCLEITNGHSQVLPRHAVKVHICHNPRAKDSNIRQALIDRFGPPGTKKNPGLLYGISGDLWQALALAITFAETTEVFG